MQFLFILIAIIGGIYFLFKKRNVDFFTIAFFSATVYFMPGFFGYVLFPPELFKVEIESRTYTIFIVVLTSIIFFAITSDYIMTKEFKKVSIIGTELNIKILVLVSIISFCLMVFSSGPILFTSIKSEIMEHLNRYHIIWTMSTSILVVSAFLNNNRLLTIFSFLFLSVDLLIGFRSIFAITVISIILLHLNSKGKQRLIISNYKIISLGLIVAIFFFVFKRIQAAIKLGLWDIVIQRVSSPEFYIDSIIYSEPFITQSILNEIIKNDFTVDNSYLYNFFYLIILFAPQLGAEIIGFNELFQDNLFPNVNYGLGANIWAEMYSINGYPMIITFLCIFNIIIIIGNKLINIRESSLKATLTLVMIYWTFYIHRNSLFYELNLQKRVILIWLGITFISIIFSSVKKK